MSNITFALLSAAVRAAVFPEGEAENLVANHNRYIMDGLIEMQKIVPCYQDNHIEYIQQCATNYNCGATVLTAPEGRIVSVSTLLESDNCDRVFYTLSDKADIDCRIRALADCGLIPHTDDLYYSYCDYVPYAELAVKGMEYPSCDTDHTCRSTEGVFARWRDQLWMFPNINCNELVVLEWDGVKIDWQECDPVIDDRELKAALELYLAFHAAMREDCDREKYVLLKSEYEAKRAFIYWSCSQNRKSDERLACVA